MAIKYSNCPRCGKLNKCEGHVECNSRYPAMTWSGECSNCGYPDDDRRLVDASEYL